MFGLFKKKSEIVILQNEYKKLMKEAFELSKINRTESDKKYAQADDILKKMEILNPQH